MKKLGFLRIPPFVDCHRSTAEDAASRRAPLCPGIRFPFFPFSGERRETEEYRLYALCDRMYNLIEGNFKNFRLLPEKPRRFGFSGGGNLPRRSFIRTLKPRSL